jgi:hypothetical protein
VSQHQRASPIIPTPGPTGKPVEWAVYLLRKRAQVLGRVMAPNEKEALQKAYGDFEIPESERFKISVKRIT